MLYVRRRCRLQVRMIVATKTKIENEICIGDYKWAYIKLLKFKKSN